ncbi:MAG TPA: hypothetical protein VIS06_16090 [Mycobacteriales bacterium]
MTAEPDLGALLADAPPEVLARLVLSVAVMHRPDGQGRCLRCQRTRHRWVWWWRGPSGPCPTLRLLVAELRTARMAEPRWTPA